MPTKGLAFFPWWAHNRRQEIGPISLIPYERGKFPGDSELICQHEIDTVLQAYVTRPQNRIKRATLIEIDDWRTGQEPQNAMKRLFTARQALTFGALAERRLFLRNNLNYCNSHNFTLYVQQFPEGNAQQLVYETRRRDGGTLNAWSSDGLIFQEPTHVHKTHNTPLDEALAQLLMGDAPENWLDAITEYNLANTDSSDTTEHVELVQMKSAFEWLLQIGPKRDEFTKALNNTLPEPAEEIALNKEWQRYSKGGRPILAWVADFCSQRGASAHGANRKTDRFAWSSRSHLAFGSLFFPLLFKKIASDGGAYSLSPLDHARLKNIDRIANVDPYGSQAQSSLQHYDVTHPWVVIEEELRMKDAHERMLGLIRADLDKALNSSN